MDIQAALLAEIDAFLIREGMSETRFGRLAMNDGKFVKRLREGGNITVSTVKRVTAFLKSKDVLGASASSENHSVASQAAA